jgi:hypothetical protein
MVKPSYRRANEISSEDYGREGINALDAAFVAYSSISTLRQQIKPDHRVHGVVHGKNWQPNGKISHIFHFHLNKIHFSDFIVLFSDP